MSTAITASALKTLAQNSSAGLLNNITDTEFLTFLNLAIQMKQEELKKNAPEVYQGTATLTFVTDGREVDLPTDIASDITKQILLYNNSDREKRSIIARSQYRRFQDKIRFEFQRNSGTQVFIEYPKESTEYTLLTDTVTETANLRAKQFLVATIKSLFFDSRRNSEASSAGQNMKAYNQSLE